MRYVFVYALLFLLASQFVVASKYTITPSFEFDSDLKTGNQRLGRIILSKNIVNQDSVWFDNNVSVMNVLSGDSVCNNVSNSTYNVVGYQLLQSGACVVLGLPGVFQAVSVSTNHSFDVVVVNPPNPFVSIDGSLSVFPLFFSKNNFVLENTDEVWVNITTPVNLLASTYNTRFAINNVTYDADFDVISFFEWGVSLAVANKTLGIGKTGVFSLMTIFNTGNSYTEIKIVESGNGSGILGFPRNVLSYPDNVLRFNFTYNVPQSWVVGSYASRVVLVDSNGLEKVVFARFDVIDITPPSIVNVSSEKRVEASKPFNFSVVAFDNSQVDSVLLLVNQSGFEEEQVFVGDDSYVFELVFDELGEYDVSVLVSDIYDNTVREEYSVEVVELDAVESSKRVRLPKQNVGVWSNPTFFLSVDTVTDIGLRLVELDFDGDFDLRFETVDDSKTVDVVNETVFLDDVFGVVNVSFKNGVLGEFQGVVEIIPVSVHVPVSDTSFSGEVVNYTIPEPFDVSILDTFISCEYENVDDPDLVSTFCSLEKKGVLTKDNIGIPITEDERKVLFESNEQTTFFWKQKNNVKGLWINILVSVLAFFVFFHVYSVKVKPKFRWRFKNWQLTSLKN